jgi:addiction module HigA family antidote
MAGALLARFGSISRLAESLQPVYALPRRSPCFWNRRHYGTAPIHPGEHLAEELKELRISAAELARQIDVPVNRVTGIINGQRAITADTALRLGHWFGTSAEFWLNLQKLYELRLAREEVGDRVEKLPKLTERKRIKARRAA